MEKTEGKELYGEIQKLARTTSGGRYNKPGSVRLAASIIWKREYAAGHTEQYFEPWWSEVHTIGVTPTKPQIKSADTGKMEELTGADWHKRIRNLLYKGGVIPEIKAMAAYEGVTYDNVYDVIRKFREDGGILRKRREGGWLSLPPEEATATVQDTALDEQKTPTPPTQNADVPVAEVKSTTDLLIELQQKLLVEAVSIADTNSASSASLRQLINLYDGMTREMQRTNALLHKLCLAWDCNLDNTPKD